MSGATRAARQRRLNRLEETRALGEPELEPEPGPATDPTWGPLGSLAERLLPPAEYQRLVAMHQELLAIERSQASIGAEAPERPVEPSAPPEPAPETPTPEPPAAPPATGLGPRGPDW